MEEAVRTKLEDAIARVIQRREAAAAKVAARKRVEEEWERIRAGVIVPALTELANWVNARDWQGRVLPAADGATVLEVYKGNQQVRPGAARPGIEFRLNPDDTVNVTIVGAPATQIPLAGISKDSVQVLASDFIANVMDQYVPEI